MQRFLFSLCVLTAAALLSIVQAQPAVQPASALREQLSMLVTRVNEFPEKDYSIQSWNQMRFAAHDLQNLIRQGETSDADLNAAAAKVSALIDKLEKRIDPPDDRPKLGLSAALFATNSAGPVNNVSLMWATAEPCDRFELQRAADKSGPFTTIYTGSGTSFADQALPEGKYCYQVVAYRAQDKLTSTITGISTMPMPAGLKTYSNQQADERIQEDTVKVGNTWYQFKQVRGERSLKHILMHTSSDGVKWDEGIIVMDASSHPDLADCKIESEHVFYDKTRDQFVFWGHWERAAGYANGRALVATAKPGKPFTVHHCYNPMGIAVRDMSNFIDEDGKGYLVAASNIPGQGANATIYIFRLNETYDDVVEIVAKVTENGYREAPHIVKPDGFYYLVFSQAAGWYPSRGGYVSSRSIAGPWREPRAIGNPSTFSSQSGAVEELGTAENAPLLMMGNRWVRGEGTSRNSVLPIRFADGFAFYDYAPFLLNDAARSLLIPLQTGQLLSQGKKVEASIPGKPGSEPATAVDGDYFSFFQSDTKDWPFTLTIDLEKSCEVKNVQTSWHIHKGSEAFYTYAIEGSIDGEQWTTLKDRTDPADPVLSKTYGFTSDLLPENSNARYVRLKVVRAHLHNNPNNWYPPTVYEVKVFGDSVKP